MRNRLEADPQISLAIKNLAFGNQQQIEQTIQFSQCVSFLNGLYGDQFPA